jgi:hypothetical protein
LFSAVEILSHTQQMRAQAVSTILEHRPDDLLVGTPLGWRALHFAAKSDRYYYYSIDCVYVFATSFVFFWLVLLLHFVVLSIIFVTACQQLGKQ